MADTPTEGQRPLISVVLDGYNESRFLGTAIETLEALQRQDFPLEEVEVVLIGSSAQVEHWQEIYSGTTPFFALRFIALDGAHYLQLKVRGAQLAAGEIVALTDSDVFPRPTWLPSIVEGIRSGADAVVGLSLFKRSGSWEWDSASRLAAASITWGWVVGKHKHEQTGVPEPVGFMDHNIAFRPETFRSHPYRLDQGRLLGAPLLYRKLKDSGLKIALHPRQQVVHFFSWRFWLVKLHFRYGYEVYLLRRMDRAYPNQWIARTTIFEPLVTMAWHVLLDVPRWFRVSRLLGVNRIRRIAILPLVIALSTAARCAEMAGMYATMMAPAAMKRWAEAV
jgi:glycosyltransferase involved in cell wall biosynthesis